MFAVAVLPEVDSSHPVEVGDVPVEVGDTLVADILAVDTPVADMPAVDSLVVDILAAEDSLDRMEEVLNEKTEEVINCNVDTYIVS